MDTSEDVESKSNYCSLLPENPSPLSPMSYIQLFKWLSTESLNIKHVQYNSIYETDKRLRKILPWLVSLILWSSLIFYSLYLDIFVLPSIRTSSSLDQSIWGNMVPDNGAERSSLSHFIMGKQSGFKAWLSSFTCLASCLLAFVTTGKGLKIEKVYIIIITSFFASSIVQTKILFWLHDPYPRALFILSRFFEYCLLFGITVRIKLLFGSHLSYFSGMLITSLSLGMSLVMISNESSIINFMYFSFFLYLAFVAISILPLVRKQLRSQEAELWKMELYIGALSPFCISTITNLCYYICLFAPIPLLSFKNTIAIISFGLAFGVILFLGQKLSPYSRSLPIPWMRCFCLSMGFSHAALIYYIVRYL